MDVIEVRVLAPSIIESQKQMRYAFEPVIS